MLDYTKLLKKTYRFILNYEIIDNNIVVHYANDEDYVVPYSKDIEKILLVFMKNQILSVEEKFLEVSERHREYDDFLIKFLCGGSLVYSFVEQQFLAFLSALGFFGIMVFRKKSYDRTQILLEDYEKNKFFVDNEEKFIEFGVDVNINDLDKYSKSDLFSMLYKTDESTLKRVIE